MRRIRKFPGGTQERLRAELQQAAQALLNRPWITKRKDPEMFVLVKSHYEKLRDWFHDHAGFSLIVTRSFAKLEKIPGSWQPWMRIETFHGPRDYALFAYGLWYLEGRGEAEQFLLSEMVDAIRDHLLSLDVNLDWTLYEHRLSMARALKKLRELEVLVAVEGEESDWAREGGNHNVLYEASPMARYVLRRFPKDLTAYESMEELIAPADQLLPAAADPATGSDVQARRQKIFRRLIQEPVVYDWQWPDEERRYVQTQRSWLIEQMRNMLNLEGRRFREGLLFTWTDVTGEMELFPTLAGESDLLMLLAGEIRRILHKNPGIFEKDEQGNLLLTRAEFEGILSRLKEYHGDYWSKGHREKTSSLLADELIAHLREWNLGMQEGVHTVKLYPAFMRWNGTYGWKEQAE
ncbi:TIGR02678 family protein [Effusibacillus dendaii]|uniref:TIGR02678 family protein n=1 Tax=Effusibacillus dendaii TaxID=2743772 RepID=A0A7I8D9Q1_9BACL|nr:TIGR02678 family protein [Effusibacillus dendaii]BCJ86805.1 TIGR02678 family protein [Effusibacillus dendaii]